MNKDLLQKRIQQIDSDIKSASRFHQSTYKLISTLCMALNKIVIYWIEQLESSNAVDPAKIPAPAASSDT
jgi:hypothetical protein